MEQLFPMLRSLAAQLRTSAANMQGLATTIDEIVTLGETPVDPAPVDPTPVDPEPVDPTPVDPEPTDPEPVDPEPVDPVEPEPEPEPVEPEQPGPAVPSQPIWELLSQSKISIPGEVLVKAGTRDIYIPVTADQTERESFYARVDRLINVTGGGINVGSSADQRRRFAGMDEIYRWSPGDDLTHYIKLEAASGYSAGKYFRVDIRVHGLGVKQKGGTCTVRFVEDAELPDMPPQYHRPMRKLVLDAAARSNSFDPRNVKWSDSGFTANGTPCWRARLSHGYSQPGNGETGIYLNEDRFPADNPREPARYPRADKPISYDADEDAIRLHTKAFPDDAPAVYEGLAFQHQAAVLQGQNLDDVCGEAGVWRAVLKSANRKYSWPAFWLVGRGIASNGSTWGKWPPEIDIFEHFNESWGARDTVHTTTFGQHYGRQNSGNRLGAFGNEVEVNQWFPGTAPLHEEYHSYACAVVYDPEDTTKSEVTFFFNDEEIGCQRLFARHEDLRQRVPFMPIINVAVREAGSQSADDYNNDPLSGDMLIKDVAYFPSGFSF